MLSVILGCAGPVLSPEEKAFFRVADPFGFILFARNVENPEQLRQLTQDLRDSVGRKDAPILVDQEGGRVLRMRPPHWPYFPAAEKLGQVAERDMDAGRRVAWLHGRLLAQVLMDVGIDVDCWPSLDLRFPETHVVIGDRSLGRDPQMVTELGRAGMNGLLAGGVMPVIKHMPGHGRTLLDSHLELPRVTADIETLRESDFLPFRALRDAPWGMSAHMIFSAVDPERPATVSPQIIRDIVRGEIGFSGLLLSDDLSMEALSGTIGERTAACLAAGCDIALHCNAKMQELRQVVAAAQPVGDDVLARIQAAELHRRKSDLKYDLKLLKQEYDSLLG